MTALPQLRRSLPAVLAVVLVAGAVVTTLLLTGGDEPRPAPPEKRLFVDPDSRGGPCSDARAPAQADAARTPWCSLQRAVSGAPKGTTVLFRGHRYPASVIRRSPRRPVTLRAYPGERATLPSVQIVGGGVRLEGFDLTGTVELVPGASHVALVNNRSTTDGRNGGTNLAIGAGVHDLLVAGNRIAQRRGAANANAINFSATDATPAIRDVTLRANRIGPIQGGGDAIQAKHTRSLVLDGNEIFGVARPAGSGAHPDAFQSIYGAVDLTLRRNFIHDIAAQGIVVQSFRGANAGLRVEDNVIVRVAPPWTALALGGKGTVLAHNTIEGKALVGAGTAGALIVGNVASGGLIIDPAARVKRLESNVASRFVGPRGVGSELAQPVFRDPARNDYRLAPGSPGAGDGGSGAGARTADFSGH